mmetsp:Transcript_97626/g.315206  ORF Transcript_97626/g.315206 Transcript_97626/m.315206 type:complete len:251 (+) Transcript_97626:318-1070(+)
MRGAGLEALDAEATLAYDLTDRPACLWLQHEHARHHAVQPCSLRRWGPRPDRTKACKVLALLLRAGGVLRQPAEDPLQAVEATGELHKVGCQTPDVCSKAVVGASRLLVLCANHKLQHLWCNEGQGATAMRQTLIRAAKQCSQAEVCETHSLPVVADYEVGGLQVAVANHAGMQVGQSSCLLLQERLYDAEGQHFLSRVFQGHNAEIVQVHVARMFHHQNDVRRRVHCRVRSHDAGVPCQVQHDAKLAVY